MDPVMVNQIIDMLLWTLLVSFIILYVYLSWHNVQTGYGLPVKFFGKVLGAWGRRTGFAIVPFGIMSQLELLWVNEFVDKIEIEGRTLDTVPLRFTTTFRYFISDPTLFLTRIKDGRTSLNQTVFKQVGLMLEQTKDSDVRHSADDGKTFPKTCLEHIQSEVSDWGVTMIALRNSNFAITDDSIKDSLAEKIVQENKIKAQQIVLKGYLDMANSAKCKTDEEVREFIFEYMRSQAQVEHGGTVVVDTQNASGLPAGFAVLDTLIKKGDPGLINAISKKDRPDSGTDAESGAKS